MAKRPTVPKFGSWDNDDVGYTVYFDKVRQNKGATAPPLHRPHNPNDPIEGPMMIVPPPSSSRPATAGGQGEPQPRRHHGHHQSHHRRTESSSSTVSDPGGAAYQSKFAPPPQYYQYQQRVSPQPQPQPPQQQPQPHHQQQQQQHGNGHGQGHRASHANRQQQQQHAAPGPRARSASPQTSRQRPAARAVPKFGVWDEQSSASAAQGFTVVFENVKRNREVARSGMPHVPRVPSPPEGAALRHHHQKTPFVNKMFGCFLPPTAKS